MLRVCPRQQDEFRDECHVLIRRDVGNKDCTVVIIAPPWPRGGSARVIQSQIEFYRSRGYRTVLICVPLHWTWVASHPEWEDTEKCIEELGADRTALAAIS